MMDMELLESQLAELPLMGYFSVDPKSIEFNDRIRWICENECPMCGKTWACPPAPLPWAASPCARPSAAVLITA